jgi:DNA helicase-2/ATP-dependent DNA helicase PcrA
MAKQILDTGAPVLDSYQKAAVMADADKALMILAPPGSGKTTTLCCRMMRYVYQLNADPDRVLALTFSVRACRDMRSKLQSLQQHFFGDAFLHSDVRTFHSWSLSVLRFAGLVSRDATVWDTRQQRMAVKIAWLQVLQARGIELRPGWPSPKAVKAMLLFITVNRMKLKGPESFMCDSDEHDVWVRYRALKNTNNAIDYDDMLELLVLHSYDNAELRQYVRDRYDYVLIDEVIVLLPFA